MKWVAVLLIVLVVGVACGDVVNSSSLEARVEAIEEALSRKVFFKEGFSYPWLTPRPGLVDVGDLEQKVDSLEWSIRQMETGWR